MTDYQKYIRKRVRKTIKLRMDGKSIEEIAVRVGCAEATVKNYLYSSNFDRHRTDEYNYWRQERKLAYRASNVFSTLGTKKSRRKTGNPLLDLTDKEAVKRIGKVMKYNDDHGIEGIGIFELLRR